MVQVLSALNLKLVNKIVSLVYVQHIYKLPNLRIFKASFIANRYIPRSFNFWWPILYAV